MTARPVLKRPLPKPHWLKRRIPSGKTYQSVQQILKTHSLHTVCQEAACPNLGECFSSGTATFLILGDRCTRDCRFCAVAHGPKGEPDCDEPQHVAEAVDRLGLRYVVITSVTRDDLDDGGAGHFADTIQAIRQRTPATRIEVLIPDFQGSLSALQKVVATRPDVLNHNLETVLRLYALVRPGADYQRSLQLLRRVGELEPDIALKSGLMLGLGEKRIEVEGVLKDLLQVGCGLLTLGQYLQPSANHLLVKKYITPAEFDRWRTIAIELGFQGVAAGPFVRSSYQAHELFSRISEARSM